MRKILDVNNLNITFDTFAGPVSAVRGVSFTLHEGETLAIVGESGSGKSVASKSIRGILLERSYLNMSINRFEGKKSQWFSRIR